MKLNYRRTFFVGLAFLSISAFWQMYDNIIPLILRDTFGLKDSVTGAIMAIDNVLAVFLLPIIGTLSDKVDTRWKTYSVCSNRNHRSCSTYVIYADCGWNEESAVIYRRIGTDADCNGNVPVPGRCVDAGFDSEATSFQGKCGY